MIKKENFEIDWETLSEDKLSHLMGELKNSLYKISTIIKEDVHDNIHDQEFLKELELVYELFEKKKAIEAIHKSVDLRKELVNRKGCYSDYHVKIIVEGIEYFEIVYILRSYLKHGIYNLENLKKFRNVK